MKKLFSTLLMFYLIATPVLASTHSNSNHQTPNIFAVNSNQQVPVPGTYLDLFQPGIKSTQNNRDRVTALRQFVVSRAKLGQVVVMPNEYVVVLKSPPAGNFGLNNLIKDYGLNLIHNYSTLPAFAVKASESQIEQLSTNPQVARIWPNIVFFTAAQPIPCSRTTTNGTCLGFNPGNIEWPQTGLMRIGGPNRALNGAGITIAQIDTGIELNPDMISGVSPTLQKNCVPGEDPLDPTDENGHGSHVAGIMLARHNRVGIRGVAPQATLAPIKVFGSQGAATWADIICGIDFVTQNANQIQVVNMSLGGFNILQPSMNDNCQNTATDPLYGAICTAVARGIIFVVAAGNYSLDITPPGRPISFLPASYDAVITVSALSDSDGHPGGLGPTTSLQEPDDTTAIYSNYVSNQMAKKIIKAPGTDILSWYLGGTMERLSGTSMAAPHVAAAIALIKQRERLTSRTPRTKAQLETYLLTSLANGGSSPELVGPGNTDPAGNNPEPLLKINNF